MKSSNIIFTYCGASYILYCSEKFWYCLESNNEIVERFQSDNYLNAFKKVYKEFSSLDTFNLTEEGLYWYKKTLLNLTDLGYEKQKPLPTLNLADDEKALVRKHNVKLRYRIIYAKNKKTITFNLLKKTFESSSALNIDELQAVILKLKELKWI